MHIQASLHTEVTSLKKMLKKKTMYHFLYENILGDKIYTIKIKKSSIDW